MATQFPDQVSTVLEWFKAWNECEQIVLLCSLLRQISSIQTKFLAQVFKQMFDSCVDLDLEQHEKQANNPEFISSLCKQESKPVVLAQLLETLPLLQAGNDKAKLEYLRIIPKVMAHSIKHAIHLDECRHILSYLILHPAFSRKDLPLVSIWQHGLSEAQSNNLGGSNLASGSPPIAPNNATAVVVASSGQHAVASTSVSLPPTSLNVGGGSIDVRECAPDLDSFASLGLLGNWSTTGSLNHGSLNQWTLASSGRDSGFSEVDRSPSSVVSAVAIGRPLKSSTSAPLADVSSHSSLIQPSSGAGRMVEQHALLTRTPVESARSLDKCMVQLDHPHHPKLLFQPQPSVVGSNAPSTVTDWLNRHLHPAPGGSRMHLLVNNPDSLHAPLSPQSSITSSGSGGSGMGELHLDERRRSQTEDETGMQVSLWLKSLRLHKYAHLFQNITYDEMLSLTEERLEEKNVTKGARNKIILSIQKLNSRQETLRSLEKNLMGTGNIRETISEMMQMLRTPLKQCEESSKSLTPDETNTVPSVVGSNKTSAMSTTKENEESNLASEADSIAEGDLPGQMTRLLGKVCTQLLVGARADGECVGGYLQLLDRSLSHQAFNKEQKKKMTSWKQQIYRCFHLHAIQKQNLEWQRLSVGNALQAPGAPHVERRALRGQQVLSSPGQPSWSFGAVGPRPSSCLPNALILPGQHLDSTDASSSHHLQYQNELSFLPGDQSLLEGKQMLGRTKSAPIHSAQMGFSYVNTPALLQENCSNDDIHASLDSLCISMTEHALAGSFGESL